MAAKLPQGAAKLTGFKLPNRFEQGLGAQLPAAYRKFWEEWRIQKPAAVHYIPKEGLLERNELTGQVTPVQNVPIPLMYPKEHNLGIWGGEAVVKGFQKRNPTKRRVPHFWVPVLKRSVVYSVVLNKFFSIVVTDRTLTLIHDHHGFDHYLLKTPACDLKSALALTMKRSILQELEKGCPTLMNNPSKRELVLEQYSPYLKSYTSEEIEWYGYTFTLAIKKLEKILREKQLAEIVPHKTLFRQKLIEQLKEQELQANAPPTPEFEEFRNSSLLSKFNPFGGKK